MTALANLLDAIGAGVRYLGFALVALGLLAMLAPVAAGAAALWGLGVLLLLAAAALTLFGWQARKGGKGPLGLVIGALTGVCGLVLFFNPISSLDAVTTVVSLYLVIQGASAVLFGIRLRPEDGWPWVAADGLLSVLLGVCIWIGWPVSGIRAVGLLLGLKLVSAGAVMVRIERTLTQLRTRGGALRARLAER
jgi:uncharacterized membrane protein HdeD (DUF308 family)